MYGKKGHVVDYYKATTRYNPTRVLHNLSLELVMYLHDMNTSSVMYR